MTSNKNIGKKILSTILSIVMILSLIPFGGVIAFAETAVVSPSKAATVQYPGADRGNGKLEITNDDFSGSMSVAVVEFSDVSAFANAEGVTFNAYAFNSGSPNGATFEVYVSTTTPVSLSAVTGTDNKLYTLADMTGIESADRKGHEVAAALKAHMTDIGAFYCGTFDQTGATDSQGNTNITVSVGRVVKNAAKSGNSVYITMFITDMVTSGGWIPDQSYADKWSDIYFNNSSMNLSSEGYSYSDLNNAIAAYEAKMDGTVYKNMLPAYRAYIAALEARDSYFYGGDTTADASTAATLTAAVNNMTEWKLHDSYTSLNPASANGKGFEGDTSQNAEFLYTTDFVNNAVFIGMAYDEYSPSIVASVKTGWYNSPTVLVYDGEEQARMPVMVSGRVTEVKTRYIYAVYPGDANGDDSILKLSRYWFGNRGDTLDYTWTTAYTTNSYSAYNYATSQNLTTSSPRMGELDKSNRDADRRSQFMSNVLYVDGNGMNNVLYKNYGGDGENNTGDFYYRITGNEPNDRGTGKLKRSISVLNYAYHKEQIDTDYLDNVALYTADSSNYIEYLKAIDTLTKFNISLDKNGYSGRKASTYEDIANSARLAYGYNYSHADGASATEFDNALMAVVACVSDDLKLVSDKINACEAQLVENGAYNDSYEALRSELSTSMNIYENDAMLYNGFSWSIFADKLSNAKRFMSDADNGGIENYYNNASEAEQKRSELAAARIALDKNIDILFDNEFDFDSYVFAVVDGGSDLIADKKTNSLTFTKTGNNASVNPVGGEDQTGYMTLVPGNTYRITYDFSISGSASEHTLVLTAYAYTDASLVNPSSELFTLTADGEGTYSTEWTVPEGKAYVTLGFGVSDDVNDGTFTFSNISVQNVTHSAGSENVSTPMGKARANNSTLEIGNELRKGKNLDDALPTMTKTGYIFDGWYSGKNGTGEKYTASTVISSTENVHLWSNWIPETYRISLNSQGADETGTISAYTQYDSNEYFSDRDCTQPITSVTIPVKAGNIFGGYFTEYNGAGTQYIAADGEIINDMFSLMSDKTLYAMWTKETYNISFVNDDGTVLYTTTATYGTKPTYRGATPTKASDENNHYQFSTWTPEIQNASGDITYTAVFTESAHNFEYVSLNDTYHQKVCNDCGYSEAQEEHTLTLIHDEYEHWTECTLCSAKATDPEDHIYGDDNECDVCNYVNENKILAINITIDTREWTSFEANSSIRDADSQLPSVIKISDSDVDRYKINQNNTGLYITLDSGTTYKASILSDRNFNDESVAGNNIRFDLAPLNGLKFADIARLNVNINILDHNGDPMPADITVAKVSQNSTSLRITIKNDETGVLIPPHTHSDPLTIEGLKPGENTDGWKDHYKCKYCVAIFADEELTTPINDLDAWKLGDGKLDATGHVVTNHADCTHDGVCDFCGEVIEPALGHNYVSVVTAPTCTEQGYTTHTCSRCDDSYVDTYVDATGHTASAEADCTHDSVCNICGTVVTEALGHDYQDTVTAPTCTEQGYTTHTCSRCNDSYVDTYVDATGHTTSTDADCTHDSVCDICGTVVTEALGHDYQDTVTAPTCTEQGFTTLTCSRCNDSYIDSYTDPTGHSFSECTVDTAPTAENDGVGKRVCTGCDATETHALAKVLKNCIVDDGFVYGLSVGLSESDFTSDHIIENDAVCTVTPSMNSIIGTGSTLEVVYPDGETVIYTVVIFGDVTGDGWYDGMDAVLVNCINGGMLTHEQAGEAAYKAADCNHDGNIDEFDAQLLEYAGVLLGRIEQSTDDPAIDTASIFDEYISLVDQDPGEGTDDSTPTDDSDIDNGILYNPLRLIDIIKMIIKFIIETGRKIISAITTVK